MTEARTVLTLSPSEISVGYFVFGVLWIALTDVLLATVFVSQQMPTLIGLLKGWIFVTCSAVLIFSLSRLHQHQMTTTETRLKTTNQQLQVLHRVFRHNIRNDLNLIRGYTELVSDRACEDESRRRLAIVQQTAERIVDISEKLKIVERVDPTQSDEPAVDLVTLVTSEVERIRASYPAVTIETDLPERARIEGAPSLKYAIREVLENADTHHHRSIAGCEIVVRGTRDDDAVTLEIADNGPGIPDDELRAFQMEAETPLVHSSSIGLWLVTWLCRLHGGTVDFRSDDGTTIAFRFEPDSQHVSIGLKSPIRKHLVATTD